MNVKYENSLGQIIDLNDKTYFVNQNELRDFEWGYNLLGRPSGLGGRVRQFSRRSAVKKMNVAVRGADFVNKINALHALTEPDILTNKPGKLWLDEQYLICYLGVSSEILIYREKAGFAEKEMEILAVEPFWNTESHHMFTPSSGSGAGGKKYNLKFAYRFGTGYSNQTLFNSHYTGSPMKISIFGAVDNPSLTIGGHIYAVTAPIAAGERLDIDQIERKVEKVDTSGVRTNLFNSRDKNNNIFKYCPPGPVSVNFSGLTMEITLIQQRSEPLWI